jgi:hypothetical protein
MKILKIGLLNNNKKNPFFTSFFLTFSATKHRKATMFIQMRERDRERTDLIFNHKYLLLLFIFFNSSPSPSHF